MNQRGEKCLGKVRRSSPTLLTWIEKICLVLVFEISFCFVGLPSAYWRMPKMCKVLCLGTLSCIHGVGRLNWQFACSTELRSCPILQGHLLSSLLRVLDIKITRSPPSSKTLSTSDLDRTTSKLHRWRGAQANSYIYWSLTCQHGHLQNKGVPSLCASEGRFGNQN